MATRGSVAIVGAAESDIGAVAALMSPIDLMAQGIHRALADAGLTLRDVDGVFCACTQARTSAMSLVEYLGLPDAYTDSTIVGGSSFEIHVAHAHAALEAGLCNVAVIAYGSTQRTVGRRQASVREYNPYETPFRPFLPASAYAMAASRHMFEFGTTREQLAEVAVAAREWALLNPAAWEKQPLTIADVLNARPISDPFTVRDCCLVTDGGGAIVMTRIDRARDMAKLPVPVLGWGQAITHASISSMPDLTHTGAIQSGAAAYRDGGDDRRRISTCWRCTMRSPSIRSCSWKTSASARKAKADGSSQDGRIGPTGDLAVNTNGGGLSYCHPGMYGLFLLIEAVRQLRGECGARQVAAAEAAIVHGNGGVLSAQATVILGGPATV